MDQKRQQPKRDYTSKCEAPKGTPKLEDVVKAVCENHNKTRRLVNAYSSDFIMMRDSGQ